MQSASLRACETMSTTSGISLRRHGGGRERRTRPPSRPPAATLSRAARERVKRLRVGAEALLQRGYPSAG